MSKLSAFLVLSFLLITSESEGAEKLQSMAQPTLRDKIVVATFLFKEGKVEFRGAILAFGSSTIPKTPPKTQRDFWVSLVDDQGKEVAKYGIFDPRKQFLDEGEATKSEKPIFVDASYTARLPFDPKVKGIRILKDDKELAKADLVPIIKKFCAKHADDKDCKLAMQAK
jgi:hypothetical protein